MNELKLNILELSVEQIMRKIKSLKADHNLVALTLTIKRKYLQKDGKDVTNQFQLQNKKSESLLKNQTINQKHSTSNNKKQQYTIGKSQEKTCGRKETEQDYLQSDNFECLNDKRIACSKKNYAQGNYDTAITILIQMLQQAHQSNKQDKIQGDHQRKIASITFNLANCYYRQKNYQKAIQLYSMQIQEQNYKRKAMRKSNLAAIYLHLKKNQESLKNYTQALKIYSQCGCEDVDLSNIYHNLGNIYLREHMFQTSSKYFQLSIDQRKIKSPQAQLPLFYSSFRLGVSQKFQLKHEQSLKNLFYALSLAQRGVGDVLEVWKQIATTYELLGKFNDVLGYYEKICDSCESTDEDKANAYEKAGIIYIKSMKNSQGLKILKTAQHYYQKLGNQRKLSQIRKKKLIAKNQC